MDQSQLAVTMETNAVILGRPMEVGIQPVELVDAGEADIIVDTLWSGISTGTEKLFWNGTMPPFPGMGYPLVPGYESVGRIVEAGPQSGHLTGELVFIPGARCFKNVSSLFGANASRLVVDGKRAVTLPESLGEEAVLLALAATAEHALNRTPGNVDLIIGHGVLGRLMARIAVAKGALPPVVWEVSESRLQGASGYEVINAANDPRKDYDAIIDASGDLDAIDEAISRLRPNGSLTLAGFYRDRVSFSFPQAFMREVSLNIAAEFKPEDVSAVLTLVASGRLSLSELISHRTAADEAAAAYHTAFNDPECIKMILDWSTTHD